MPDAFLRTAERERIMEGAAKAIECLLRSTPEQLERAAVHKTNTAFGRGLLRLVGKWRRELDEYRESEGKG